MWIFAQRHDVEGEDWVTVLMAPAHAGLSCPCQSPFPSLQLRSSHLGRWRAAPEAHARPVQPQHVVQRTVESPKGWDPLQAPQQELP